MRKFFRHLTFALALVMSFAMAVPACVSAADLKFKVTKTEAGPVEPNGKQKITLYYSVEAPTQRSITKLNTITVRIDGDGPTYEGREIKVNTRFDPPLTIGDKPRKYKVSFWHNAGESAPYTRLKAKITRFNFSYR